MAVVTVEVAAREMVRSTTTVHGWIRAGAPVVKKGRGRGNHTLVNIQDLEVWLGKRNAPPSRKRCAGCGWTKPISQFHQRRYSKTGPMRPISLCKECERARHCDARDNGLRDAYKPTKERAAARRRRRLEDQKYLLNHRIHRALAQKMRQAGGSLASFGTFLDFTLGDLRTHLEKQFLPGMTWQNYGEWEIDHIVPKHQFQFDSPSEPAFKACWSLTNLRPVWRPDNLRKGYRRQHLV